MYLNVNDLMRLYGNLKGLKACYKMIHDIKIAYGIDPERRGVYISVRQYCDYTGSDINEVYDTLGWKRSAALVAMPRMQVA